MKIKRVATFGAVAEISRIQSGGKPPGRDARFVDIYHEKPVRLTVRVVVPVKEHPKFNFVGKLLGPKGNSMKRLQEETMTKMAVLGRGSMRNKQQEEGLRNSGDPKYHHLNDDLHVEITAFAPPSEAYARMAYALTEIRKYLIPDSNDEIRQEQMREMELLSSAKSPETDLLLGEEATVASGNLLQVEPSTPSPPNNAPMPHQTPAADASSLTSSSSPVSSSSSPPSPAGQPLRLLASPQTSPSEQRLSASASVGNLRAASLCIPPVGHQHPATFAGCIPGGSASSGPKAFRLAMGSLCQGQPSSLTLAGRPRSRGLVASPPGGVAPMPVASASTPVSASGATAKVRVYSILDKIRLANEERFLLEQQQQQQQQHHGRCQPHGQGLHLHHLYPGDVNGGYLLDEELSLEDRQPQGSSSQFGLNKGMKARSVDRARVLRLQVPTPYQRPK